jgi:Acetyltransferase (GNAT) domain
MTNNNSIVQNPGEDPLKINDVISSPSIQAQTAFEDLELLRLYWSALNRHPDADIDFFSFLVRTDSSRAKPVILLIGEKNEPKAILIGRLDHTSVPIKIGYLRLFNVRLRRLTFIGDGPNGYLGEYASGTARLFISKILDLLREDLADCAVMFKLPADSEMYEIIQTMPWWLQRDYQAEISPRRTMRVPDTLDDYFKKISSKRRWQLRNLLKIIEKDHKGGVICKTFQKEESISTFCEHAEMVAKHTYQRGLCVGFMNTESDRQRLNLCANKGWWRAYILYSADKPIAFWSGLVYKSVWYSVWTGYDTTFQNYRPGTVLLLKIMEDLGKVRVGEIDFGFGEAEYKERFGDHLRFEAFVNIYARNLKGATICVMTQIDRFANRLAKSVLARFNLMNRIKQLWRKRLAAKATKQDPILKK